MFLSADKQIMAPIRALIVDDSSVMRKIIDRTLRQAGLELETVYEASSPCSATCPGPPSNSCRTGKYT